MTDTAFFEEIYREYQPKISGYIHNHVNNPEDAEDLCSEVFRKAWEHIDTQNRSGFSSFLYTVTRNTVFDYFRTHRQFAPIPETKAVEDDMSEKLLQEETLSRLAAALKALPEPQRELVVLRYYKNKTLQEIAEMMDLSYGVTKRLHKAALDALRGILAD